MIRRDYILRMIEEFIQALSRIRALKKEQLWSEAATSLDDEFKRLIGAGAQAVAQLSQTELVARLIRGEPTQVVHTKTLLLVTLLQEAGDLATRQERPEEARACYSKGLNLLLYSLAAGEVQEMPEFVPSLEVFVSSLNEASLPVETNAMLMQHYERTGEFAKAEDALFAMLEAEPKNLRLIKFGIAFYRRLELQNDASLETGNLPRAEVEAGLADLRAREADIS
jgi:tetratricopeptide (TPR) repeat protein